MSKHKPTTAPAKPKPVLSEAARADAALTAAGRATCIAEHLPEKFRKQLAALVSVEGVAVVGTREKVITILRECGKENKAVVDGMNEAKE